MSDAAITAEPTCTLLSFRLSTMPMSMRRRPPPAPPTVKFVRLSLTPALRLTVASSSVMAAPVSTSQSTRRPLTLAITSKSLIDARFIATSL